MKLLICSTCKEPALATRSGLLQCAGRLSSPTVRILCRRCGRTTIITSSDFNRLPEMTPDELSDQGLPPRA